MSRIFKAIVVLGAITMFNVAVADGAGPSFAGTGYANLCFEETVKVANGADPDTLTTIHCTRALRSHPLSRQDRSAMLHNRGIILQAQGDLAAARRSFERAVSLSNTVDQRNLALALVAHKLGDYRVAFAQYDLLLASDFAVDSDAVVPAVVANRAQAIHRLERSLPAADETRVVGTQR